MENIEYILLAIVVIAAIILAVFYFVFTKNVVGEIHINSDNPEKDIYDLKLKDHPETLKKKRFVIFFVKKDNRK